MAWFAKEKLPKMKPLESALEAGTYAIDSIGANRLIAFEEEVISLNFIKFIGRFNQKRGS